MTLSRNNTRHTLVYAGIDKTVTLLKRGYDQQEGTVVALKLFRCFRSSLTKTGEPLQRNWTVGAKTTWVIPRSELRRVGVTEISVDDRIVERSDQGDEERHWQPEAEQTINIKVFENFSSIECVRCDPPGDRAKVFI